MLTLKKTRKLWAGPVVITLALVLTWLVLGRSSTAGAATPDCYALTDGEMNEAFGDSFTLFCAKTFNCDDGLTSGSSCVYRASLESRVMCCPLDTGADCTYTGATVCENAARFEGAISGMAGYCGSCTSTNYSQNGTCNNIKNAVCSKNCPP